MSNSFHKSRVLVLIINCMTGLCDYLLKSYYLFRMFLVTIERKRVVSCTFYLLDLDYPPTWLLSLSILQKIMFEDKSVHPDCQANLVKAIQEIEQYCYE